MKLFRSFDVVVVDDFLKDGSNVVELILLFVSRTFEILESDIYDTRPQ